MAATSKSMTTFLILSDTHNLDHEELPENLQNQPKVHVLLHCGDLTQVGGTPSYKRALRLLGTFDAELKLVIAGNHDLSLDKEYWMNHLDEGDSPADHEQAVNIMTGDLAREMGVTYLTEGLHHFTLKNGTTFSIYCTPYQPKCGDWASSYKRGEDRFNLHVPAYTTCIATESSAVPDDVDIMMTHGPPFNILDRIPSKDHQRTGCEALLRAVSRARPLLHCFGHIHEGYGIKTKFWDGLTHEQRATKPLSVAVRRTDTWYGTKYDIKRKEATLMVNAAIMDRNYKPVHAPWLVELEL